MLNCNQYISKSIILIILVLCSCNKKTITNENQELNNVIKNDSISLSEKYYNEGKKQYKKGDLQKAKVAYKAALNNYTSTEFYTGNKYFEVLFGIYLSKNEYGDAISLIREFDQLVIYPEDKKKKSIYAAYIAAYTGSLQYNKAQEYISKLYDISKDTNDEPYLIHASISESNLFHKFGDNKKASNILNNLINKDLDLDLLQKSYLSDQIGIYEYYQGNYHTSIEHYSKSLSLKKQSKIQDKINHIAIQYVNIADAYIALNDIEKAKVYLDSFKGLDQGKISNSRRRSVFKNEFKIAQLEGKESSRLEDLIDKFSADQEKFYTERYNKELESLTEEKEKSEELLITNQTIEIEKLNLRSNAFMIGTLLLITLLSVLFIVFKQRRDHLISSLKNQQRLLRTQMNPHFTFNVLSSIQNLVRKDSKAASKYITKFSRLLRLILENSTQNYVPLEDELEILQNYLDLQKLRFPDLFDYKIEVDDILKNQMITIPPMLIQPFVENAIEHGFKGISYTGKLKIALTSSNKRKKPVINCTISDNGVGYGSSKINENKKSTSIHLISSFIKKSTGNEIKMSTNNISHPTGTVFDFTIPTN